MGLKERQAAIAAIEKLRKGRCLIVICNFDRPAQPPELPGPSTQFQEDMKEPLYCVLKGMLRQEGSLDVFLYTGGGSTNAVWPIAGLLAEFDSNVEVLIPFRAHSSGTLLALAGKKIIMTRLSELSPIDPATTNAFNPRDSDNRQLDIAVEDVMAYQEFWRETLDAIGGADLAAKEKASLLLPHLNKLSQEIHPLALGNVHRVCAQILVLAKMLLQQHYKEEKIDNIVDLLSKKFHSHHHKINRHEARKILGDDHVEFASPELEAAMDALLLQYEDDFKLRQPFFLSAYMGNDTEKDARFVGGIIESGRGSYIFETKLKISEPLAISAGQLQVSPENALSPIAGLPKPYEWQITEQGWRPADKKHKPSAVDDD